MQYKCIVSHIKAFQCAIRYDAFTNFQPYRTATSPKVPTSGTRSDLPTERFFSQHLTYLKALS